MKYRSQFSGSRTLEEMLAEANLPSDDPKFDADGLFSNFKEGDQAIHTRDGAVVQKVNGKMVVTGKDEDWLDLYKRLQNSKSYKENTAFKIIERTCKADAYATAIRYLWDLESGASLAHTLKLLKLKRDTHRAWVAQFPVRYDYATQSFIPNENAIDPSKVEVALTAVQRMIEDMGTPEPEPKAEA